MVVDGASGLELCPLSFNTLHVTYTEFWRSRVMKTGELGVLSLLRQSKYVSCSMNNQVSKDSSSEGGRRSGHSLL